MVATGVSGADVDQQALVEYRYRAVREVLGGSPIGEVAARYGTSRQSVHAWRARFQQEGLPGLADRSRRPKSSPNRLPAEVEALVCELRRQHPRWGARRIVHELELRGVVPAPSRATVHRVLVRNGLRRCLKRYLARELFKALTSTNTQKPIFKPPLDRP